LPVCLSSGQVRIWSMVRVSVRVRVGVEVSVSVFG
jgi:hypothetical protein